MGHRKKLIEDWTELLDDNAEQQLHAMGMLHEVIEPNSDDLTKNLNALTEVTPKKQKHRARALQLCAGLAVILFALIAWKTWQMYPSLQTLWYSSYGYFAKVPAVTTITPEENFLLYGDTTRNSKANQMRALWEREPNNPAFYAEYSRLYHKENKSWPADFLEIAEKIDPDNGWFLYVSACELSKGTIEETGKNTHPNSPLSREAYEKLSRSDQANQGRKYVTQPRIVNPILANQALMLWKKSLEKPRFDSYELELHHERYPILSHNANLSQLLASRLYTKPNAIFTEFSLHSLLAAMLQKQDSAGHEIEQLMQDIDQHISRIINLEKNSLIQEVVRSPYFSIIFQQIYVINTDDVDPKLVETWQQREASYASYALKSYLSRKEQNFDSYAAHENWNKLSYLLQDYDSLVYTLLAPITPSSAELAPLRYAEHSFTMRIVAIFSSVLFLLFFPFNLTFRRGKPLLRLGAEVWPTVPWSSHAKLFSWSVLLPMAYFASLYWFTPFAGKDTGIKEMFLVPYIPAACVGLIMLILPRILIHRTTKHWEMMGHQKKNWSLVLGWLCVVLALIPMHALTFEIFTELSYDMLYIVIRCCMIPSLLWLIINGLRERFSRQPYRRVMHALRRTMLLPCSAASIVVLVCTIFALQSMETYWVKKDTLLALSPDAMTGGFEARVMKALDREQRQALGLEQE
jgi:hypothetical protein